MYNSKYTRVVWEVWVAWVVWVVWVVVTVVTVISEKQNPCKTFYKMFAWHTNIDIEESVSFTGAVLVMLRRAVCTRSDPDRWIGNRYVTTQVATLTGIFTFPQVRNLPKIIVLVCVSFIILNLLLCLFTQYKWRGIMLKGAVDKENGTCL